MDDRPLLRPALRAIGLADVRFGFLPPHSGLRRNDEQNSGSLSLRMRANALAGARWCCNYAPPLALFASTSLPISAMPAIDEMMPDASNGSISIFWFGESAIAFSASTYLVATK